MGCNSSSRLFVTLTLDVVVMFCIVTQAGPFYNNGHNEFIDFVFADSMLDLFGLSLIRFFAFATLLLANKRGHFDQQFDEEAEYLRVEQQVEKEVEEKFLSERSQELSSSRGYHKLSDNHIDPNNEYDNILAMSWQKKQRLKRKKAYDERVKEEGLISRPVNFWAR